MIFGKQPHILNAASNLLGICFVLITALKLTKAADVTWADEIAMFAAIALLGSCVLSYISLRNPRDDQRYEKIADYLFLSSLFALFIAVLIFAFDYM